MDKEIEGKFGIWLLLVMIFAIGYMAGQYHKYEFDVDYAADYVEHLIHNVDKYIDNAPLPSKGKMAMRMHLDIDGAVIAYDQFYVMARPILEEELKTICVKGYKRVNYNGTGDS